MKTVTITIPLSEAQLLFDDLPIARYPRTVLALVAKKELETSHALRTVERELTCGCDSCDCRGEA